MLQGGFDSGRRFGRRFGPFLAKSRSFSRCQARSGPGRVFGRGRFSGERKIFLVRLFFSAGVNLPRVRPRARPVPSIFFFFFFFFFFLAGVNLPRVGPARGPSEITPGLRGAPSGAPRARDRSVVARGGARGRGHRKSGGGKTLRRFPRRAAAKK